MTIVGFDADQDCSRVAAAAKAKGVGFICRYLKNLTAAEVRAITDAGLKLVSIFETTAERALAGAAAGAEDGAAALAAAARLGQPAGAAIYATADFGETAPQDPAVVAYFSGFATAIAGKAKLGVYGEGAVCQAVLDAGVADYTWLAGGSGMRGTAAFAASGRATIAQDVGDKRGLNLGIDIDSDVALVDDYGGWNLAAPVPLPSPSPAPEPAPDIDPAVSDFIVAVKRLQTFLRAKGLYHDDVDGDFGPESHAALAKYLESK
jgi:hypothetical protein